MSIVRYTLETLPSLTDADRAQLKKLADMPDSEIDFSDIPELTEEFWKNAVRGKFYKPTKKPLPCDSILMCLRGLKHKAKAIKHA